jgi:hypothetical protein
MSNITTKQQPTSVILQRQKRRDDVVELQQKVEVHVLSRLLVLFLSNIH